MIKFDIVNRVAERANIPKMKAEQAVDALFHSMKEALARGERIELRGFGVFVVKPRKRNAAPPVEDSAEVREANELLMHVWENIHAKRDGSEKADQE